VVYVVAASPIGREGVAGVADDPHNAAPSVVRVTARVVRLPSTVPPQRAHARQVVLTGTLTLTGGSRRVVCAFTPLDARTPIQGQQVWQQLAVYHLTEASHVPYVPRRPARGLVTTHPLVAEIRAAGVILHVYTHSFVKFE
jgi:hypothetical protein